MSTDLIGSASSNGFSQNSLAYHDIKDDPGWGHTYPSRIWDYKMEYDGGSLGYLFISEAGFSATSTDCLTLKTFWGTEMLSVQYKNTETGTTLSNNGMYSDTNDQPNAGVYEVIIQGSSARTIENEKSIVSAAKYSNTVDGTEGLNFSCIEIGSKTVEIVPYDLGRTTDDKENITMTVTTPGTGFQMDAGGNLSADFGDTITLEVELLDGFKLSDKTDPINYTAPLVLGTDYELVFKDASAIVTDGSGIKTGTITLGARGLGNFQGTYWLATPISVTYTDGILNGMSVSVQGTGDVYIKPDNTIDLDSMKIQNLDYTDGSDGNPEFIPFSHMGADYDYSYETEHTSTGSLQYKVTVKPTTGSGGDLVFTVTANAAGTGTSFAQGEINLISSIYAHPDRQIYPEDVVLLSGASKDLLVQDNYTNTGTANYKLYYQSKKYLAGDISGDEWISWMTPVSFADDVGGFTETTSIEGERDEEDVSFLAFTFPVKVVNSGDADDFVIFNVTTVEGGAVVSSDFGTGSVYPYMDGYPDNPSDYDYSELVPTENSVYIATGFGVVLSAEDLDISISITQVEQSGDGDKDDVTFDYTDKKLPLSNDDIEAVTTYAQFTHYLADIQDGSTSTTQLVGYWNQPKTEDGSTIPGTLFDFTKYNPDSEYGDEGYIDLENYDWFLTLHGVGGYTGDILFQIPADSLVFTDVAEDVIGVLGDYLVLDTYAYPDGEFIYQKPDGSLYETHIVLYHRVPTLVKEGDKWVLQSIPLSTNTYSLGGIEATYGSVYPNVTGQEHAGFVEYDLDITTPEGDALHTLADSTTAVKDVLYYAYPAGEGDSFRHGYLSLVEEQTIPYIPPTGEDGEYSAVDLAKVFSALKIYGGYVIESSTDTQQGKLLEYGTDYSISIDGSFNPSGKNEYTVTMVSLSACEGYDSTTATNNIVTFQMTITMDEPSFVVAFDLEDGTEATEGDCDPQSTTSKYKLVNFPENPSKEGHYFIGWSEEEKVTDQTADYLDKLLTENQTIYDLADMTTYVEEYLGYVGTIYAVWGEIKEFHLHFDWNYNGTSVKNTVTYTDADGKSNPIEFPVDEPSREGYTFLGWNTQADGLGDTLSSGSLYSDLIFLDSDGTEHAFAYAQWEELTFTVYFDYNGGSGTPDKRELLWLGEISLPTPTRSGYSFTGWTYNGVAVEEFMGYHQLAENLSVSSITLVAGWDLIPVAPTPTPPSTSTPDTDSGTADKENDKNDKVEEEDDDDDEDYFSGGSTTTPQGDEHYQLTDPDTGKVTVVVPSTAEDAFSGGSDEDIFQALADGDSTGSAFDLVVKVDGDVVDLYLSHETLTAFVDSKANSLTVLVEGAVVTFDREAMEHILLHTPTYSIIALSKPENSLASNFFGDYPYYDLRVLDGSNRSIDSFGNGVVKVAIAYDLAGRESGENLILGQVSGMDLIYHRQSLWSSLAEGNYVQWIGTQLGIFGVLSLSQDWAFVDGYDHWAKAYLEFTNSRDLYRYENLLSVEDKITREVYVGMLGMLLGIDPTDYLGDSRFTDVDSSSPYAPYVNWASAHGITAGVSPLRFAPEDEILREEMAIMLVQYVKILGVELAEVPSTSHYSDQGDISSWAVSAVAEAKMVGLMDGNLNGSFNPQGSTTYAEHAVTLYRLVETLLSVLTYQVD